MRRLRALLSAGRFAHGAGVAAPARRVAAPGGIGRRAVLGLIGAAPIALPSVVRATVAEVSTPARAAAVRLVGTSTPYLGAGRRLLIADEVDPWPAVEGDFAALREQRLLTWPEGPEKDRLRAEVDAFLRTRRAPLALAQQHPVAATPCCPAFIDDVGSGP